jgi:hypothetical protein
MKEQPARAIRRFEVLILRPLSIALPVAVVVCLVKTAWVLAVVMVVCWFVVGAIGQSLPHRRKETFSELASGEVLPLQDERLSSSDSRALARASMQTGALLAIVAVLIAWKNGLHGWLIYLVLPWATFVVVVVVAALISVGRPQTEVNKQN